MSTDTTPVDSHERQHLADKASVEAAVSSTPHLLRRMGGLARPYRKGMVQGGLLVVLYAFTTLAGPYLVSVGIDQGIAKHDGHTLNLVVAAFVAVACCSPGSSSGPRSWSSPRWARPSCATCGRRCSTTCSDSRCRSTTVRRQA